MAENTTIAIRTNEEVKELFRKLYDDERDVFNNNGDFLKHVITMYESNKTKQTVSKLKPAIETVELLTTRILETLNGVGVQLVTEEENYKIKLDEYKGKLEKETELLKEKLKQTEEVSTILDQKYKDLEVQIAKLKNKSSKMENSLKDKSELIDSYKAKLTEFEKLENALIENEKLKKENEKLKNESALQKQQDELKKQQEILDMKSLHQKDLMDMQNKYTQTINGLMDKLESNKKVDEEN